ncbi:MAG: hypothetical protein ACPGID_05430 [Rubricella sp.]
MKTERGGKKLNVKQQARRLVKGAGGEVVFKGGDGARSAAYLKDGVFDYALYREVQELANRRKLNRQWVTEAHVAALGGYLRGLRRGIRRGICHGTRRGNEQRWFMDHIGRDSAVIGTEISDTAADFPDTVQWDFHDRREDWVGAFDFVYSNSWDHAYDPALAFSRWVESLRPGGVMLLDCSADHGPDAVDMIDAFGAFPEVLAGMLEEAGAARGGTVEILSPDDMPGLQCPVVVLRLSRQAA